MEYKE